MKLKIGLGALAIACLALTRAQAVPMTIDLSVDPNFPPGTATDVLGDVNPPEPADPADYVNYINAMIPLSTGASTTIAVPGGTDTIYRSENAFTGLTAATLTGDDVSGSNPPGTIKLTTGYEYLVGKYDGPNGGLEVWDISSIAAGDTIVIPQDAFGAGNDTYGLSGWVLFDAQGTGTQNVPDGGSTALLLGIAFFGACLVGRHFSVQPKQAMVRKS